MSALFATTDPTPAPSNHHVRNPRVGATFVSWCASWLILLASATALADPPTTACVDIDPEEDALSPDDQRAARTLLRQTFRAHGVEVVDGQCPMMFTEPVATFHKVHALGKKLARSYPR